MKHEPIMKSPKTLFIIRRRRIKRKKHTSSPLRNSREQKIKFSQGRTQHIRHECLR